MENKILDGYVDKEERKIEVIFDEDQGYVTFVLSDYSETEVMFEWDDIKQLGLEMDEALFRKNKTIRTIQLG